MLASYEALSVVFVDDLSPILIKPQPQSPPLTNRIIHLVNCLLHRVIGRICEVLEFGFGFFKIISSFLRMFQLATRHSTNLSVVPASRSHQLLPHSTPTRRRVDLTRQTALPRPLPKLLFYGFFFFFFAFFCVVACVVVYNLTRTVWALDFLYVLEILFPLFFHLVYSISLQARLDFSFYFLVHSISLEAKLDISSKGFS